jgi:WD40 repeat protein
MSVPNAPPCLFLSHSGADTDAARELKRRLLESPDARAVGLRVWLDKDDLAAGLGWQAQIEKAITEDTTAFAVHIGTRGVVNWVENEVRLALSRATGADYPFIPILAKECLGSAALPPFARQYHGVRDPLGDSDEFVKLLYAVLRRSSGEKAIVLESPFVGLKAMTEADADRFFGRNEEIAALVDKLKRHRLIAIVADSGAGKSSLAQAGFIPKFRGGALSDTASREPDDHLWHVVVMRPRRDPIEGLKRGVTEAAERLGRSAEQCAALRRRIAPEDPSETAYAIRCDLPVGNTETLLIVDQFEELLTETAERLRPPFVDLLMGLQAVGGFRVVLTLRADHFNLCRPLGNLFEHLTRDNHGAVLRLQRITDQGIIEAVRRPLRLAGHTDVVEQDALIESIRRDISDRAGDLALVQMALYAMWQKHRAERADLLVAYSQVGGVVGALAHEAEHVRTHGLDADERALLASIFVRLVRLGETGGATRRAADLADFDGPRRLLTTRLATEGCGRLLLIGEKSVEVAHEALITQWPWLQDTLNEAAGDMRVFDRLMDRASRWNTIGSRDPAHLATGAEREEFTALAARHPDWLSSVDGEFVAASDQAHAEAEEGKRRSTERLRWMTRGLAAAALVLIVALGAAVWSWRGARIAEEASRLAAENERTQRNALLLLQSRFLVDLANQHISRDHDPGTAMLLGLEALPDPQAGIERPLAREAEVALFRAYQELREAIVLGNGAAVLVAALTPDGRRIATISENNTARMWDAATGGQLSSAKGPPDPVQAAALSPDLRYVLMASAGHARLWELETGKQIADFKHGEVIWSAAFSPDGGRVVTASDDNTARVWEVSTGKPMADLRGHKDTVRIAAFSPDGRSVLTGSDDATARLWNAETGRLLAVLEGHAESVRGAAFSPKGDRAITTSTDKTARLWNLVSNDPPLVLTGHTATVWGAAFSPNGQRIVTVSDDKTARLWEVQGGTPIAVLEGHDEPVRSATFSRDGRHLVTASDDGTARVWDVETGQSTAVLKGHSDMVRSAAFSPDGRHVLTASADGTARLWSVRRKADGQTVFLEGHAGPVRSAVFAPDGRRVATASRDSTVRVWDAEAGRQVAVFDRGRGTPGSVAFSPNGQFLAIASDDNAAVVIDTQDGRASAALKGHRGSVGSVAFSPDSRRVVTASEDGIARVFDVQTAREIVALRGHSKPIRSARFSPDGKRVATASDDNTARLWAVESGTPIATLEGHLGQVYDAAFSPDGKRIVTAGTDKTARIWDAETGKELTLLNGHERSVYGSAFSPDGRRIVTASDDTTARIWDAWSGETLAILEGHAGAVWSAAFSPDGERVVTASEDKTVRIWPVFSTPQALIDRSKMTVPRCLTQAQRVKAFLDPAPPPTWCIEQKKWPYHSAAWANWLQQKRPGANPPLPAAPE